MEKSNIPWHYKGIEISPDIVPDWAIGMVYRITDYTENKIYIGKKLLNSTTRKKIGVREKAATKTRKTFKKEVKDSGWMTYNTSCKPLQNRLKTGNPEEFKKEIIEWAFSKRNLSWLELKWQVRHNVLEVNSYNDCAAGHYWRRDVVRPVQDKNNEQ